MSGIYVGSHLTPHAYLVAGAAAGAVQEERLVAAGNHGVERVPVHVLEAASTTCK